ncbi:histidine kinase N-terminal 7TM domain-containing protein [Gilvimarinus xylanilyticus]|uniref:diguanylate cyclase n=1 Tax=Gilvimarinus xylanilyticus TaxID=2944139 RepID=A0A9X2HZV0_9GAMM|nr:histidine kinase N-terminal 7TM domain-containing protein [Gilvimarinus xylanilyticus]MCP8900144.1 diguanylate cyclase [Gilvimarinus xylanilyticus]
MDSIVTAFHWTPAVALALAVCLGVGGLIHWTTKQSRFPGKASFVGTHLASLWWMLAAAAELAALPPSVKMFFAAMAWPGIVLMPSLWALFLYQYTRSDYRPLHRGVLWRLSLAPVCFWLLALTNPWHHGFYTHASAPINADWGAAINYHHGPLFYLAAVYVYCVMLASIAMLIKAIKQTRSLYRNHFLAMSVVTLIPWVANIGYVFFDLTLFGFDPTPFTFAFSLSAFIWLIQQARLFDAVPLARHLLLEALPDPVLVIDRRQRLIDANPAALALSQPTEQWQAQPLAELPTLGSRLAELLHATPKEQQQTLELPDQRFYETRILALHSEAGSLSAPIGQMIYLRDISHQHLAQRQLTEALQLSEQRLDTISQLHKELQAQAIRDPLTGLYNRRFLDEFFIRELARAKREHVHLALAMIDLDHFKSLNDRYGHQAGDDVLAFTAHFLSSELRESDGIFRIGGEEFLVILPGLNATQARERLSYVGRVFSQESISTGKHLLQASFSAGLAAYPEQGETLEALIAHADTALYRAKALGRNRAEA